MPRTSLVVTLALLAAAAAAGGRAEAAIVAGGSTLLTQAYADQLETWLGEGPITLTNIFAKESGDNGSDFHAAADGQGRTITLIEVLSGTGYHFDASTRSVNFYSIGAQIIGGYNPQSWSSSGGNNYTYANEDRTAFLFNLTNTVKQDQKLSSDPLGSSLGRFQTYNHADYGPTFGGGDDIYVDSSLSYGHARSYSYGSGLYYWTNPDDILIEIGHNDSGDSSYGSNLRYGAIEVFTIAAAPAANGELPEPAQLVAWTGLTALGACGAAVRRRRHGS